MKIIPLPNKITEKEGQFLFSKNLGISCDFLNITDNFNQFLNYAFGYKLTKGNDIVFILDVNLKLNDEGYILDIDDKIQIKAKTEKGLFYGMQTLKQIVFEYANGDISAIPKTLIEDEPRFSYRGFMLDCCRHFFSIDTVKQCIEACALHKLNVFHWHLTEDQGWRIEIEKYPELINKGSKRKCTRGDGVEVSGYYTKNQIREIIKFAADRYIEVIPEIDMPGHTTAAIASYPELWCRGTQIEVATSFGIKKEILCAGKESTYRFVFDVLDEVAELFPSKYMHLGGDEALKLEWNNCADCQAMLKKHNLKNMEQLQAYFTKEVVEHLKTLNKTAITWNESLNSGILDESVTVQYWQDGSKPLRVLNAINSGRNVIVSKFSPYYLDYPYGMIPMKKTYNFEPYIKGVNAECEKNIIGVESPLWTEYVDTVEKIHYQTFPRLTAVSETGWTFSENKNYKCFVKRLSEFSKLLKLYGINVVDNKESNPNFFKGKAKLIKFLINAIDKDIIKTATIAQKETKKMRKADKK